MAMPDTSSSREAVEIAIIGGGLGGLCLAQGLVRSGLDVAVYERDASAGSRYQGYRISLKAAGAGALRDCLPANLFDLAAETSIKQPSRMISMDTQLNVTFSKPTRRTKPWLDGFGVNRLTLREIMFAGIEDIVHFGRTFERYEPAENGRVRAWFTDGTSTTADLLVGADGTESAVRAQLIPAAVIDELHWAIYGCTPITAETLSWMPEILIDSFARVNGDRDTFAMATCRTREPVGVAAARLAPAVHLTDVPGYLQWITTLTDPRLRTSGPAALHAAAADRVRDWHPALRRVVAAADVGATFAVRVTSARRVAPWHTPNVTLLGDAIHTMSPGRGDGANIALRDAQVLRAALANAATGRLGLAEATKGYQEDMLEYGFAAVAASLHQPFATGIQRR
jgi:2-polyprenyl-6-methoxyphenol hydroxylase-like FAD-dependent oxidoreductase